MISTKTIDGINENLNYLLRRICRHFFYIYSARRGCHSHVTTISTVNGYAEVQSLPRRNFLFNPYAPYTNIFYFYAQQFFSRLLSFIWRFSEKYTTSLAPSRN